LIQIKLPIGGQRFLPDHQMPIDLNRPAVELLRSVQVRIEGSSQAADEKP
jgi:hypothetical protein